MEQNQFLIELMKEQIKDLKDRIRYPKVKITMFTEGFHLVIKGELRLPPEDNKLPDELLVSKREIHLNPYGKTDVKHIEYLKQQIIREISEIYIRRAVEYHESENN